MKTKLKDTRYCGVSKEKIKTIEPILNEENLNLLEFWIKERYLIHYRKDHLKKSFPWTDNETLKKYRFTNVKRYHDRETLWLLKNITHNKDLTYEERLINSILFRSWNKGKTMDLFGGPFKFEELKKGPEHFRKRVEEAIKENPKFVWYTPAFNTGGAKSACAFPDGMGYRNGYRKKDEAQIKPEYEYNIPLRMFFMINWVIENNIIDSIKESKDQSECFSTILKIHGYGPFLAYQVFVDLSYIPEFPFSENEFTIAGPGCRSGIDRIVENKEGLSYEEIIFWFRDNQDKLFDIDFNEVMKDLPKYDRRLTTMDFENAFCEISKFIKSVKKEGRPRVNYKQISKNSTKLF